MTITFVGHGYVGLVTACVFADLGNTVYVVGRTDEKIKRLQNGDPIIYEPGLQELLQKNLSAKRIFFTKNYEETIPKSDIVFIAVGTPPKENGEADLSQVLTVADKIGKHLKNGYTVVSCKSTVPVGTNRKILSILKKVKPPKAQVDIASCPEFLREGTGLQDTFYPDRIVMGTESQKALDILKELHKTLPGKYVMVGIESAEIIKYVSNSILATKISFANLISFLCEKTGANVEDVLNGVGLDKRIGRIFLNPGIGYGGSCFPKDVKALIQTGESLGVDMSLLKSVDKVNLQARKQFVHKVIKEVKGKNIGVWGLAFKPNTDDIREAPSVFILNELLKEGFNIKVHDQEAMDNIRKIFNGKLTYCENAYDAARDSDALLILTEWNEFKQIDLSKVKKIMKQPLIIDGRNIYLPTDVLKLGFSYISVGR